MKLELARQDASKYHLGQFRKDGITPFVVHPMRVSNYFNDKLSKTVALLHDTVEDNKSLSINDVRKAFGDDVADGVYFLTRNVGREEYKARLNTAPDYVKKIKLYDTWDNIQTLECLSERGVRRKVNDCRDFYIPMARDLEPNLAVLMEDKINDYITRKAA